MRPLLRVLILCLPLLTIPAMPVHAAASAPSIFPPTSAFVLPASVAGGKTTVTPLSPQDLNSPVKPLSRTEYDLPKQLMQSYKVEVFRSSADAQFSFKYQMTHLPAGYRFFESLPDERYYYLPGPSGFNIVATVFRNIEFVTSSGSGAPPAQDERVLLGFTSVLVGRAQAFAAHPVNLLAPTPPIFPPDSVFMLPPNAVRQPVKGVNRADQLPAKVLDQAFGLFTHQHGSYSYFVTTFRSSTDAVQDDGNNKSGNHGYTLLRIRQPVTAGEWLKEDANVPPDSGTNGGPYGAISVGLVYRNLSMVVYVDVEYHDSPATKTSRMIQATQIALDTASQLYGRAQAFAAHPFKASPTTPSLTPAQQDRNAAMRRLVKQINDALDPCRVGFSIVSNDVQDLINKSGSVATTDGDAYNALSPCDAAGTALEGLTPPNVLKGYASIHTLIQQEAKVTRTYVNYLILVKADMDDAMNGRAPIGTASDFTKASDVAKAQDQQGIDLLHKIDQAWHYSS